MAAPVHVSDLLERSRPLKRFCQRLRDHPLLVIPLFLALYGCAWVDVADFAVLSSAPLELHAEPRRQFLQYSPLTYFLGYPLTRAFGSRWSYVIVMLGGLALAVFALRRFAIARYGTRHRDALLMLFATPLLIVLSQYIGKSDAYVVTFLLLAAASTGVLVQTAFACLLVLSHFELGVLVLVAASMLRLIPYRSAVAGGALGVMVILGYHHYVLPAPSMSRVDIGMQLLSESVDAVLSTPVLHLVWSFGPFWLCVLMARHLDTRWLAMLAATAAIATVTLDFTRVFSLVGLPIVIAVIDRHLLPSVTDPMPVSEPWLDVLPLCAFFQAHLISQNVYDSRIPEIVGRVLADAAR